MDYLFSYSGPVMKFDVCINPNWSAQTMAPTKAKAKSNLAYRYKKENGYARGASIKLPGEIKVVN